MGMTIEELQEIGDEIGRLRCINNALHLQLDINEKRLKDLQQLYSHNSNGIRIREICKELRGKRIDIVDKLESEET